MEKIRHIIPISGKDSLATALVQTTYKPELNYEYVFNPTGLELPEVFEWIDKVGNYLGKPIIQVSNPLLPIIKEKYNYFLPSQNARYCTRESKIEPFVDWVGDGACNVYYGIRADENRAGFNNKTSPNITPVYPLQQMGIGLQAVYLIVNNAGLKPPTFFWESVYVEVKRILGFDPKDLLPEWMFDMLFSWRSRANCDRCFNQRYYEWVGLLEHHPNRFWDAEKMENKGTEESEKSFTWSSNKKSLNQINLERIRIKIKRIDQIVKAIRNWQQLNIFEDDAHNEIFDVLQVKSCGLFCGK